jgi:cytidylate kinase
MTVIALTQGMGSLAQDVAEGLAEELGLRTVQHELAERVADRMHVSKSLINRLRSGKSGLIEGLRADKQSMALYTAEEVLEAAVQGQVVIRGWGATQLLRPVSHVPCIRIMRPFEHRVQWLMKQLDTDDRDLAETELRRSDHANATRMHDQFGVHWGDPVLFDMVLNTERLSVQTCVKVIKDLVARPEFAPSQASQELLAGLGLSAHVRAALSSDSSTHAVDINIESVRGQVTLSGIVADDAEKRAAENVAAKVDGVLGVDNQLRTMSSGGLAFGFAARR